MTARDGSKYKADLTAAARTTRLLPLLLILLFVALAAALSGCGGDARPTNVGDEAAWQEGVAGEEAGHEIAAGKETGLEGAAGGEQRYAWPLATASPEDTVTQLYAEKFAEEVLRLSDGTMRIQVYPNSTLGGDRELLESCADGDIPFLVQNTAPQVSFMPRLAVFDLPCAFSTLEEARAAVDDPEFYRLAEEIYREAGYRLLGYADQGFRVMSSNREVKSLADFRGQKIRTMENPYHLKFWRALEASPTPMNFGEVYIGLQQKTIDAQENPYEVIVSGKLYEQQDYIIETNHLPHYISLIVSDEFYGGLSGKQQEVIREAAATAVQYAREQSDLRIGDKLRTIEDSGTKLVPLSDGLSRQMRDASAEIYREIRRTAGDELVDAYLKNSGR